MKLKTPSKYTISRYSKTTVSKILTMLGTRISQFPETGPGFAQKRL